VATPELAAAGAPAWPESLGRTRAALAAFAAREALPIAAAALHVALVAALLPFTVVQDTWLALVAGREVSGGLPQRDTLTVLAGGAEWVDQQWLGQLALYGLHALGGLGTVLALHAGMLAATLVAAVVAARRLGGSPRAVGAVAAGSILLAPWAWQLRAQSLVYPLFVAVVWLLAADARRPSRRALLVLPLLALWANVHGSVLVGALLVVAAGALGRRWLLVAAAPLCVLASPYALQLPGYYRTMFLDADLGRFVVEWGWTAPSLATAPFWGLAALTGWAVVRRGERALWFDRIALAVTLVGGVAAIRSVVWFGLAAVVLLPNLLSSSRPYEAAGRPAARLATGVAVVLVATAAAVSALSLPGAATRAERLWPAPAADAVAAAVAADPDARVFASERYADWLLWRSPELRGRIAFDARFELLPPGDLDAIARLLRREGAGWKQPADGYRILVLDPARPGLVSAFAAGPGARVIHSSDTIAVVLRRPA
jgi:hypothetical protein